MKHLARTITRAARPAVLALHPTVFVDAVLRSWLDFDECRVLARTCGAVLVYVARAATNHERKEISSRSWLPILRIAWRQHPTERQSMSTLRIAIPVIKTADFESLIEGAENLADLRVATKVPIVLYSMLASRHYPHLTTLDVSGCSGVTDNGFAILRNSEQCVRQLSILSVAHCTGLTDEGASHISGLTSLTHLNVTRCKFRTLGFQQFGSRLVHLVSLTATGCLGLCDVGIAAIASGLARLAALHVGGCKELTDAAMSHLGSRRSLTTFSCGGCTSLSDAGFAHLSACHNLSDVDAAGCVRLTDVGIASLAVTLSPTLARLNLTGCAVTDDGLSALTALASLTWLNLTACRFRVACAIC